MDYTRVIEHEQRMLVRDVLRRLEKLLEPFQQALNEFLARLFQGRLPFDWRQQWQIFIAQQTAAGFSIEPQSVREMETWIESWARYCGLLPVAPESGVSQQPNDESRNTEDESRSHHVMPGAGTVRVVESGTEPPPSGAAPQEPASNVGDMTPHELADAGETAVSNSTGVPLNKRGPNQQTIPGSGPGKIRILDLQHEGPEGSIRVRGSVIEVKASATKSGRLSGRSRKQIKDAVAFVQSLRDSAAAVLDPAAKAELESIRVEVYSDLPKPKRGVFAKFIERGVLEWNPIPWPEPEVQLTSPPKSIGRPGLGAVENIALGILISIVEAGVANSVYRESADVLSRLLKQLAENDDVDERGWQEIEVKLKEIAHMKQSWLGVAWELVTYGQGSLIEKKGLALMNLAWELAEKYGYSNEKTWGEFATGGQGRFEKKR